MMMMSKKFLNIKSNLYNKKSFQLSKKTMKSLMSNPFHIVSPSPWPISLSLTLLTAAMYLISSMSNNSISIFSIFLITILITLNSFMWWQSVSQESSFQGNHSYTTMKLLKFSMIMFICSEVMFFISFFWAFFHSSISPNIEIGMSWPPKGIEIFNPMGMPLLNSIILLSSGMTITWSHHAFLKSNVKSSINSLMLTISLGIMFSICQGMEYFNAKFSFSDSIYGSSFFLTTGFHGIHVIVGTIFLMNTLYSMKMVFNSSYHFISFDLSAWYWHFVDVVWLFVFSLIYWWGSI